MIELSCAIIANVSQKFLSKKSVENLDEWLDPQPIFDEFLQHLDKIEKSDFHDVGNAAHTVCNIISSVRSSKGRKRVNEDRYIGY